MMINEEAVAMMLREANRQGLAGKEVTIQWLPPQTGTDDRRGNMIIEESPPKSGSDPSL